VSSDARIRRSASKEITALLVIDPYNEFISTGPPSIDNRTALIGTEEGLCRDSLPNRRQTGNYPETGFREVTGWLVGKQGTARNNRSFDWFVIGEKEKLRIPAEDPPPQKVNVQN
jgi:hypothetical protein